MIPFRNSLPYDIQMNEVYASACPFCKMSHVRLPLKPAEIKDLRGGFMKRAVVFPCCRTRLQLIDADDDYLLADRALRPD
ncbi:hypothetical protein [Cohnella nanjingensis]|uniref:Uncharacterized protein n=1 Tax=Cohnella nanjingensis TaxID=1387779 RepID=A0A7X0RRF8_9BACL|nr:hypothetical protein [Cohnella nanjingensis]MBB6670894.1 hypothetical protein [Cohnella nanjingensis]